MSGSSCRACRCATVYTPIGRAMQYEAGSKFQSLVDDEELQKRRKDTTARLPEWHVRARKLVKSMAHFVRDKDYKRAQAAAADETVHTRADAIILLSSLVKSPLKLQDQEEPLRLRDVVPDDGENHSFVFHIVECIRRQDPDLYDFLYDPVIRDLRSTAGFAFTLTSTTFHYQPTVFHQMSLAAQCWYLDEVASAVKRGSLDGGQKRELAPYMESICDDAARIKKQDNVDIPGPRNLHVTVNRSAFVHNAQENIQYILHSFGRDLSVSGLFNRLKNFVL